MFQLIITKGANYITAVTGSDKHFFQLDKLLLILNCRYFGTEFLNIICCIVKEDLPYLTHLLNKSVFILYDLSESISSVTCTDFIRIIESVQLFQVRFIGLLEIALNIGKIYDISILIVLVWSVYTSNSLQQIMVFQLSAEIQPFQARSIKSCQEHIENDQYVNGHILLEILDDLLSGVLIITIVQDQSCLEVRGLRRIGIQFTLNIIKESEYLSCLFARFADNHTAERIIAMNGTETLQITDDISCKLLDIGIMFNNLVALNIFFLYKRFKLLIDSREPFFVHRFYILTDNFEGIAVLNRFIVVIGVQIVTEHLPRLTLVR